MDRIGSVCSLLLRTVRARADSLKSTRSASVQAPEGTLDEPVADNAEESIRSFAYRIPI